MSFVGVVDGNRVSVEAGSREEAEAVLRRLYPDSKIEML